MGMFDELKCKYPLPVEGANAVEYQTKDTPMQNLDHYEIREDGTLWHEDFDIEDHSDMAKWKAAHPGEEPPKELQGTLLSLCGCMTRVNKRWEPINFTGEIRFYGCLGERCGGWVEFSAYFEQGKVVRLNLIEHRKPEDVKV